MSVYEHVLAIVTMNICLRLAVSAEVFVRAVRTRRMTESAALLEGEVYPHEPIRKWILTSQLLSRSSSLIRMKKISSRNELFT